MNDKAGKLIAVSDFFKRKQKALQRILPEMIPPERYAMSAVQLYQNKALFDISPVDFGVAVMRASGLGLELDPALGHVYLVPFGRGDKRKLEIIVGYQGIIELAMRSGTYAQIYSQIVYEDEAINGAIDYASGTETFIRHKRPLDYDHTGKAWVGAYAIATDRQNPRQALAQILLPRHEILESRNASASWKHDQANSPWHPKNFERQMVMKTAVRALKRSLRQTVQLARVDKIDGVDPDVIDVDWVNADDENDSPKGRSRVSFSEPKESDSPTEEGEQEPSVGPSPLVLEKTELDLLAQFLAAEFKLDVRDPVSVRRFCAGWDAGKSELLTRFEEWRSANQAESQVDETPDVQSESKSAKKETGRKALF